MSPDLSPLLDTQVTQVCLDFEVALLLAAWHRDGRERVTARLTLGVAFTLTPPQGDPVTVEPDTAHGYQDVCLLLRRTVVEASADDSQALSLRFDDGSALRVEPSRAYESWQLTGEGVQDWLVGPAD